ncbi:hypothetical protein KL915_002343 [Ogataea haglerorum]|nr:hypothetical protein KL915_002343 [Ogataea haglerorum]
MEVQHKRNQPTYRLNQNEIPSTFLSERGPTPGHHMTQIMVQLLPENYSIVSDKKIKSSQEKLIFPVYLYFYFLRFIMLKKPLKPVSRACLECRQRHLKCDGIEPVCTRCKKLGKECFFVKSNRGGSRKKGVSTKKQRLKLEPEIDIVLPCGKMADQVDCDQKCRSGKAKDLLPCARHEEVDFYPKFNSSKDKSVLNILFDEKYLTTPDHYYITPTLTKNLNVDAIISNYYSRFHYCHPFMPQKENIREYLDSIPHKYDLLLAMKLIGDGQTHTTYAKDVETVNYLVTTILDYSKQVGRDFVTLQSVLLLAMASHISSLHDISQSLLQCVVSLALELELNMVDRDAVPEVFMDVNGFVTERESKANGHLDVIQKLLSAPRTSKVPRSVMENTARRTFWELYFFDTISGTASGRTTSALSTKTVLTLFPKDIPQKVFDFKSRAECCKLVNDSIKLNMAIQDDKDYKKDLQHLKAAIGNWDLRIEDPDSYNSPYLVNSSGFVNEGVHQAVMLVNYAKIFMHRPFSYLWRTDVARKLKDGEDDGREPHLDAPARHEADSRKIIETRRTIDSASSVVKLLLDTNPAKILDRTPFFACSLAFSCLVHLSAYSWVETSLSAVDKNSKGLSLLRDSVSADELETYTEYIKLELGGIFQISRHWALSSKLVQHIKDTLRKVSPKLFVKVQTSLPESHAHVEVDPVAPEEKSTTSNSSDSNNFPTTPFYDLPVDEIDFNQYEAGFMDLPLEGSEPDTGCGWVDKSGFEFEDFLVQ